MLHNRLTSTRFQLDDVSACCEVSVRAGAGRGCEWLDGVYLEGPVRITFYTHFLKITFVLLFTMCCVKLVVMIMICQWQQA